jgi:hypothetical protein
MGLSNKKMIQLMYVFPSGNNKKKADVLSEKPQLKPIYINPKNIIRVFV